MLDSGNRLNFFRIWAPAYEILLSRGWIIRVSKVKHVICWRNSYLWWYLEEDCTWSDHLDGKSAEQKFHFLLSSSRSWPKQMDEFGRLREVFTLFPKAHSGSAVLYGVKKNQPANQKKTPIQTTPQKPKKLAWDRNTFPELKPLSILQVHS